MKNRTQPSKQGIMRRKALTVLCALIAVLVVCTSMIGGTLAYLKQVTPELKNVFELGELKYELKFEENAPGENQNTSVQGMPETMTASAAASEYTFTVENIPTLTGYKFIGWADSEDAATPDYPLDETNNACSVPVEYDPAKYNVATSTTSKTVYAVWQQMDFMVSFDTQTNDVENPAAMKVTYLEPYGALPEVERKGYTLLGWTHTPVATDKDYVTAESIVQKAENHTLYAQWIARTYFIRYYANGGDGYMATQTIEYDKLTRLYANSFTKDDYTFGGWATSPEGDVEYIDQQEVVNLLESGFLDLYAVWIQNSHTVTFDYNGGTGSPASKQVQNGKPYGTLPEYPIHPTTVVNETEIMSYLFTGWYTAPTGGTRVYPSDIVNRTDDHTLYAHWQQAPTNNVIKDLVVQNNPDDNKDGVVDAFHVTLTCSSSFEKLNIPLEGLVVGQEYKLSFGESNNATYGMNEQGYGNAIYGFIITKDKTLTPGSIKTESIGDDGLIKQFADRNDGKLNGPRNRETTFIAEASTMYWTWDYGLILDGTPRDYNYTNIKLVPVEPVIEFGNKELILYDTSNAQILNDTSTATSTVFTFDGDGYAETMYYPITRLTAGSTYTITFDHQFGNPGALINSDTYDYGCGIMNAVPTTYASKMAGLGTWASNIFVMPSVTGNTESVTLTFKATGDTAYWVWNMANVSDSVNSNIKVRLTKFSAVHSGGGSITYHSAASSANVVAATMAVSELPVIFTNNLPADVTVSGTENAAVGLDWALTLTGEDLPDILQVNIDGWPYMTGLNEALLNSCAEVESATPKHEWLTENADGSQTLTIPAELMTSSALITISGDYYDFYDLATITYNDLN